MKVYVVHDANMDDVWWDDILGLKGWANSVVYAVCKNKEDADRIAKEESAEVTEIELT